MHLMHMTSVACTRQQAHVTDDTTECNDLTSRRACGTSPYLYLCKVTCIPAGCLKGVVGLACDLAKLIQSSPAPFQCQPARSVCLHQRAICLAELDVDFWYSRSCLHSKRMNVHCFVQSCMYLCFRNTYEGEQHQTQRVVHMHLASQLKM